MKTTLLTIIISLFLYSEVNNTTEFENKLEFGSLMHTTMVNDMGAFQDIVPLELPPGVNNVIPKLSLMYDSRGPIGELGVGWSLSGISSISRTSQSKVNNGTNERLMIDKEDNLSLDGQFLVLIGGTKFTPGSKYRTENETFSIVEADGQHLNSDHSPNSFIVKNKQGWTYTYGGDDNSKVVTNWSNPKQEVLSWSITRMEDPLGNYVEFEYIRNTTNGTNYIHRIKYTGNDRMVNGEKVIAAPPNEIQFIYQRNENAIERYLSGNKVLKDQLLKEIQISTNDHNGGAWHKKYFFVYSEHASKPYLSKVTSCDNQSNCLTPLLFNWSQASLKFNQTVNNQKFLTNSPDMIIQNDFNKDGSPDFVIRRAANQTQSFTVSGDTLRPLSIKGIPTNLNLSLFSANNAFVSDFDGNNLDDLILFTSGEKPQILFNQSKFTKEDTLTFVYKKFDQSPESYHDNNSQYTGTQLLFAGNFRDTLFTEVIRINNSEKNVILSFNNSDADDSNISVTNLFKDNNINLHSQSKEAKVGDFDGDGRDELVLKNGNILDYVNDQFVLREFSPTNYSGMKLSDLIVIDVNSDGFADLMQVKNNTDVTVILSNGLRTLPKITEAGLKFRIGATKGFLPGNFLNSDVTQFLVYQSDKKHKIYEFANNGFKVVASFERDLGLDPDDNSQVTYYGINSHDNGLTSLLSFKKNTNAVKMSIAERRVTGKITKISDGYGKIDSVQYLPISNRKIYHYKHPVASRLVPITAGYTCVKTFFTSNDSGELNSTDYFYSNLKYDKSGRGMTGFERIDSKDNTNGITYTKRFSQHFPLKGKIVFESHTNQQGVELFRKENAWTFQVYANGTLIKLLNKGVSSNFSRFKGISSDKVEFNEALDLTNKLLDRNVEINEFQYSKLADKIGAENIDKASVMQSVEEFNRNALTYWAYIKEDKVVKKELDNTIIASSRMINEYGEYGFPTQITHHFFDNSHLITDYSYKHIEDKSIWILGLMKSKKITSTSPEGMTSFKEESYDYNENNGLLVKTTKEPFRARYKVEERYEYDPSGQITKQHTSAGAMTKTLRNTYEKRYRRFNIQSTNTLGQSMKYEYDPRTGSITKETDPNGLVTTHTYDKSGRRIYSSFKNNLDEVTYGFGYIQTNDPIKEVLKNATYYTWSKSKGKERVTTYFNSIHKRIGQKYYLLEQLASKQSFVLEWYVYDERGNPKFKSNPSVVQYETNPAGGFCVSYDSIGTTIIYDQLDRSVETVFADKKRIYNQYFAFKETETNSGGLTKTTYYDKKGQVSQIEDHLRNKLIYERDEWGRITKSHAISASGKSVVLSNTKYDVMGRKTGYTDLNGTITYSYDAFGNLIQESHSAGRVFNMKYDQVGRLTEKSSADKTIKWSYDEKFIGKPDYVTDSDAMRTDYNYDGFGRIKLIQQTIDSLTFTNAFAYDVGGELSSKTYHDGYKVDYTYSNGFLIRASTGDNLIWKVNKIDAHGNVIESEAGNGYRTIREIDNRSGLLMNIQTGISRLNLANVAYYNNGTYFIDECEIASGPNKPKPIETTLIQDYTYGYDQKYNMNSLSNSVDKLKEDYQYDDLNRINRIESQKDGTKSYRYFEYDAFGNIQYDSKQEKTYTYDDTYRLNTIRKSSNKIKFKYDAYGNVISFNQVKLEYNLSNLPTRIKKAKKEELYRYGHDNRTYSKVVSSGDKKEITLYPFEDQEVILDKESKKSHRNYIVLGGQLVAFTHLKVGEKQASYYVHKDHLGSVDIVTNEDGAVVLDKRYEIFGKEIRAEGSAKLDKGFGSHPTMSIAGLIHMGGRIYFAEVGRFLSADPFVQTPENLQSFNRYSYVLNNPLNYIDPSGFFFKKVFRAVKRAFKRVVRTIKRVVKEVERGIKKYGKQIIVVGVAIAVTAATGGAAAGLVPALLSGAAAGAAASATATLLNGGSFDDIVSSALTGAATGALSAGIFYGVGSAFGNVEAFSGKHAMKAGAHGVAGGVKSEISGGSFEDGFVGSAIAQAFAPTIDNVDKGEMGITFNRTAAAAVAGGTASLAVGGDFGSGAISASFSRAYNDDMHATRSQAILRAAPKNQRIMSEYELNNYQRLKFERAYAEGVKDAAIYMGEKALDVLGVIYPQINTGFPPGTGPIMNDDFYKQQGLVPPSAREL